MIKTLVLLSCYLAFIAIYEVDGLRCAPCENRSCPKPPKCPGGLVKDICNCCQVCAKQEGEKCGGVWSMNGKCDKGLVCKSKNSGSPGICVVVDICMLPKSPGPCKASFQKWYFNKEKNQCEKFIYGGCKGNLNRFNSEKECKKSCPGTGGGCPKYLCPTCPCPFGNVIDKDGCPTCECKPKPKCRPLLCRTCPYGNVIDKDGCRTCECKPKSICPPVCKMYCKYGNVKDKNGCPTCRCNPPPKPTCGPVCAVYCEYGNVKDRNGCPTCKCNTNPMVVRNVAIQNPQP